MVTAQLILKVAVIVAMGIIVKIMLVVLIKTAIVISVLPIKNVPLIQINVLILLKVFIVMGLLAVIVCNAIHTFVKIQLLNVQTSRLVVMIQHMDGIAEAINVLIILTVFHISAILIKLVQIIHLIAQILL